MDSGTVLSPVTLYRCSAGLQKCNWEEFFLFCSFALSERIRTTTITLGFVSPGVKQSVKSQYTTNQSQHPNQPVSQSIGEI